MHIALLTIYLFALSCSAGCCRLSQSQHTEIHTISTAPTKMAGILDGRSRFRYIYCTIQADHGSELPDNRSCDDALWHMDDEQAYDGTKYKNPAQPIKLKIAVIPGIFGECIKNIARPFADALNYMHVKYGYHGEVVKISGRASSRNNALELKTALEKMSIESNEKLVLIGYSKGTTDVLEMLVAYPETHSKIYAFVSLAGVVGGSPVADFLDKFYFKYLKNFPNNNCPPKDHGEVVDLTTWRRQQWLDNNLSKLPNTIKYYSVPGIASQNMVSTILLPSYQFLSSIDIRNDGQVIYTDAIIPGSTLLGYVKADHWAIALPFDRNPHSHLSAFINKNEFPREVLLESIVRYIEADN
jgi:hypothetical protein